MTNLNEIREKIAKLKGNVPNPSGADLGATKRFEAGFKTNYTTEKMKDVKTEKPAKIELKDPVNGGKREGSGRKELAPNEKPRSFKALCESFGWGEVDISRIDRGTKEIRIAKMTRAEAMLEKIYEEGMKGNMTAAGMFTDRVGGKVPNILAGDPDGAPILTQQVDINNALEKTYGETH